MSDDILGGKAAAAYNVKADGKGLILVKATDNLRDFQKSLLHEIQHAIQDYEPQMMVGSNPQDMTARYGPVSFLSEFEGEKTYYTVFGEAEARVVEDTFENPILLSIPPSQRRTKPRNNLTDRTVPLPDEELVMVTDDLSDNALRAVSGGDSAFTSQIQSLMKNAREIRKRTDRESAFNGVASLQRGYPELKMSQLQGYMGGGVNSYAIEHGGDLLHRMMEYGGEFSSNAKTKIKNLTRVLNSPYGFEREIKENAQTNYRFDLKTAKERGEAPKATTLEEFEQNIDKGLGEYAAFHANLPVFNELQLAARNFAVALGPKKL